MAKNNNAQPGFVAGQSELLQPIEKQDAPMIEEAVDKKEAPENTTPVGETVRDPIPEKKDQKPDETYVYIGPSIPQSPLKENAIFHGNKDSVLKFVRDVSERYPIIKRLIVHIDLLAASKSKLDAGGNALSVAYQELASAIKKQ